MYQSGEENGNKIYLAKVKSVSIIYCGFVSHEL